MNNMKHQNKIETAATAIPAIDNPFPDPSKVLDLTKPIILHIKPGTENKGSKHKQLIGILIIASTKPTIPIVLVGKSGVD